jgi:hypothetical protein
VFLRNDCVKRKNGKGGKWKIIKIKRSDYLLTQIKNISLFPNFPFSLCLHRKMCTGIALPIDELPEALVRRQRRRVVLREPGGARELRFLYRDPKAELPAWHGDQLCIYPWGNRDRRSALPRSGWCRLEELEEGLWRHLHPQPVDIPAALGLERGVWFLIPEGIRGVLVRDEQGRPHVYMLTQPASHYYQIMTRNARMPVLLGEQI